MERINYQHNRFSWLGLKNYPAVYLIKNFVEIRDFEPRAVETLQQVEREARANATGLVGFSVRLANFLPIRKLNELYAKVGPQPYLCYFGLRRAQHWPAMDPEDERLVRVNDEARGSLDLSKPASHDLNVSPFPDYGSNFDWATVRGISWNSNIAIRALYDQRGENQPDYALVYLRNADEINRRGGRRRPVELVQVKKHVAVGIEI